MPGDDDLGQATQDAVARLLRLDAAGGTDAPDVTAEAPVAFALSLIHI